MPVQFLSTYVLFWKLAFCKEVIIWTLRPPTASKLKRRSSYFFILVLYTKFHSNPMMGTPSNSNFLSCNLAFSSKFCCGRKKPKATNALFEWFRCKIKGATVKADLFFLKMVVSKIFFRPKISCFNIVEIQKSHFLKRPRRLSNCTHIFQLDKSYVSTDASIGTC